MFKYLYQGVSHTDTSVEYMQQLGINAEAQESIINQREFKHRQKCCEVRQERGRRLAATDHYMLQDVEAPSGVATYRQALRDVPEQTGFPFVIEWPEL